MFASVGIALSGLSAASLRVGVASNNIANMQSTTSLRGGQSVNEPYVPQEVVQISDGNGGVRASVVDSQEPSISQFNPTNPQADENGLVRLPNVDVAEQLTNMIIGGYDFRANLKAFKANDELTKSLLDVVA